MTVDSALRRPLIVVEPEHEGHRMVYFAAVAEHLLARGVPVALATSRAGLDSSDLALRLPGADARIGHIDIGPPATGAGAVGRTVRVVAELQARHPDREILVTEGDKFLPAALASRAALDWHRLRVVVMRAPRVTRGAARRPRLLAQDTVKAASMALARRRGADVRVLEQATPVRRDYHCGSWRSVPDPVDVAPGAPLPSELAGPAGLDAATPSTDPDGGATTHWIGVLGHVSPRKNLDLVLEAARLAGPAHGVLVAGRVEPGEWERCADALDRFVAAGNRLLVLDRLLSDAELDACVARVDALVLAHSSEGPSGMLGKAVALGTPVVTAGAQSLRAEIARLDGGSWAQLRAPDIAAAVLAVTGADRVVRPVALAGSADFAHALLER